MGLWARQDSAHLRPLLHGHRRFLQIFIRVEDVYINLSKAAQDALRPGKPLAAWAWLA